MAGPELGRSFLSGGYGRLARRASSGSASREGCQCGIRDTSRWAMCWRPKALRVRNRLYLCASFSGTRRAWIFALSGEYLVHTRLEPASLLALPTLHRSRTRSRPRAKTPSARPRSRPRLMPGSDLGGMNQGVDGTTARQHDEGRLRRIRHWTGEVVYPIDLNSMEVLRRKSRFHRARQAPVHRRDGIAWPTVARSGLLGPAALGSWRCYGQLWPLLDSRHRIALVARPEVDRFGQVRRAKQSA